MNILILDKTAGLAVRRVIYWILPVKAWGGKSSATTVRAKCGSPWLVLPLGQVRVSCSFLRTPQRGPVCLQAVPLPNIWSVVSSGHLWFHACPREDFLKKKKKIHSKYAKVTKTLKPNMKVKWTDLGPCLNHDHPWHVTYDKFWLIMIDSEGYIGIWP